MSDRLRREGEKAVDQLKRGPRDTVKFISVIPRGLLLGTIRAVGVLLILPRFLWNQVTGFIGNARSAANVSHGDAAPAWWTRMAADAVGGVPALFGASGAKDQIYAAVFVAVVSILLGSVFTPLLAVAGLMIFPLAMGVIRLVPAVERGYTGARDTASEPVSKRIRRGR